MFKSETEDMLPRLAPNPTTSHLPNDAPSVPEISIVFKDDEMLSSHKEINLKTISTNYSKWKKHILPKVIYPTRLERECKPAVSNTLRTLEVKPQNLSNLILTQGALDTLYHQSNGAFKNSIETQTDEEHFHSTCGSNFHLQRLSSIVQELKNEQKNLIDMCQMLLKNQQQIQHFLSKGKTFADNESQCDILVSNDVNAILNNAAFSRVDSGIAECKKNNAEHSINMQQRNQFEGFSKHLTRPTLISIESELSHTNSLNNSIENISFILKNSIEKSETDKVMNDLAEKYLTNDKLNDLIRDVNITTIPHFPSFPQVFNTIRVEKSPNDFSNASYKYLEKYRLLPEDNEKYPNEFNVDNTLCGSKLYNSIFNQSATENERKEKLEEVVLDLNSIRNQPKLQ